jgi:YidC/Oxa1 family membrane protein insertase
MENQKNFLIAIVLALAVMIAWSFVYGPQQPAQEQLPAEKVKIEEQEKAQEKKAAAQQKKEPARDLPALKPKEEKLKTLTSPLIKAVFTNQGACLKDLYVVKRAQEKQEPFLFLASQKSKDTPLVLLQADQAPLDGLVYVGKHIGADTIEYTATIDKKFKIIKTFSLHKSSYIIELQMQVVNLSGQDKIFSYSLIGPSQIDRSGTLDKRFTNGGVYQAGEIRWQDLPAKGTLKTIPANIEWLVLRNSHYSSILKPHQAIDQSFIKGLEPVGKSEENWAMGVRSEKNVLPKDSSFIHRYTFYAGPTTQKELQPLGLEAATDYGKLNFLCQILIKTLNLLNAIVHNYGMAIILLVILINMLIYPLTLKNIKSMKQMQAVQPHIAKLKEKHGDNQKMMQAEMMKLYREHQVNPLGGCLPILLQMPIFIALYVTLARSAELKGSNFLWIKDLSNPDTLAHLPFEIPFLGDKLNLLPLVMVVAMIIQQKVSTGSKQTDKESASGQQQKMMMFMPIIFGVILYNLPSGLVLYWTVNTIIMAAMHYIITRRLSD